MVKAIDEKNRIETYLEERLRKECERKLQKKLQQRRRDEFHHKFAKKQFHSLPNIEAIENTCYQRAVKEHEAKWKRQEKKRNDHIHRLKIDRIKTHSAEMKNLKKLKEKCEIESEMDRKNRQINEKIDFVFDRQQHHQRLHKIKKLEKVIAKQIENDEKSRRDELSRSRIETNRAIEYETNKDDQNFFKYANRLMDDAQKRGYPLKPLKKAIIEYKMQNSLIAQQDDLPHMKSNIDIGISTERKYLSKSNKQLSV